MLIGCHYLSGLDSIGSLLRTKEVSQAAVLIAAKIRERDIECPTVPLVAKAGRSVVACHDIKTAEININNKFQWNFCFKTPYDYLETMITIGVLLEIDSIISNSSTTSPWSDVRSNNRTQEDLEKDPNRTSPKKSPDESIIMPKGEKGKGSMATPSTNHGLVQVSRMDSEEQTDLRRKIREKCLEIMEFAMSRAFTDPKHFKTLAYTVVAYSRRNFKIADFE